MRVLLLALLMTIIVSCATEPAKWESTDKQLMWLYVGGQIIDYGQTNNIYENEDEGYREINPVVDEIHTRGGIPAWTAWKVGTTAMVGYVANRLEPKWRKRFLRGLNVIVWGLVFNNFSVGLGWSF